MKFRSLKTQFSLIVSLLIVLVVGGVAFLLLRLETSGIKADIYHSALNGARLTVERVIQNYDLYYKSKSYVIYQKNLAEIFQLNPHADRLRIANFSGGLLFDSWQGEDRVEKTRTVFGERLKSRYVSIQTQNGTVYFLADLNRPEELATFEGKPVAPEEKEIVVANVIVPFSDNERYVIFDVSYAVLAQRLNEAVSRVALITFVALLLGIGATLFFTGRITTPLVRLTAAVSQFTKGKRQKVEVLSGNEVGVLARNFNQMAGDLDRYEKELVKKAQVEHELKLAAEIQRKLLPQSMPQIKGLEVYAGLVPAATVGGDVYDFIPVKQTPQPQHQTVHGESPLSGGQDNLNKTPLIKGVGGFKQSSLIRGAEGFRTSRNDKEIIGGAGEDWLFYLGDVTGHGVSAGVIAAVTNTLFYALGDRLGTTKELAILANRTLSAKVEPDTFVTLDLLKWETELGRLFYTSCGHEQVLVCRAKSGKVEILEKGGVALGMLPEIDDKLTEKEIKLTKGDLVLVYSDGIPEALNNKKERFGLERLTKAIEKYHKLDSIKKVHQAILAELNSFRGSAPQQDDISLIVLRKN
ncbi:hypothetical protein COT40_02215 [Candidatus Peregrinibacteria bacterium CG08_land_8_20_14_0_20_41_10]|nr:MAG: hypothetical protein AUJ78_01200 [Candidatus Peregrinibacteria bacterium CG1_02_41_10]PIS32030.1 MAG: hypothetical protein COT40_02215 [Candidatus Peregrinibacteria bacterium CG08_land_8_20_14_0_20_41_10]